MIRVFIRYGVSIFQLRNDTIYKYVYALSVKYIKIYIFGRFKNKVHVTLYPYLS